VTVLGCMAAALAYVPAAHAADFMAGAGRQVTTPPEWGTPAADEANAKFAPAFAACAGFPDRGRFALQEPFRDLNGNRQWDPGAAIPSPDGGPPPPPDPSNPPEPFCDANGNGRWDGIYADNNKGPASGVHDDIDVRAVAISDGRHKPVVYASVKQIGLFDFYTDRVRTLLRDTYGVDADLVVSANHNESSPDSIGLFGAGTTPLGVGLRSGIDEYYMDYMTDATARAAADAVHAMRPARIYARQVPGVVPDGASGKEIPVQPGILQRLSDQFPTTVANPDFAPADNRVAAVDPKLGVLQARRPDGTPIFTVMSFAAHNQEMGNAGAKLSGDWPGAFESAFESDHAGMAMFLAGDVGSEEDVETVHDGAEMGSQGVDVQWAQAKATGERFAALTAAAATDASPLAPGDVVLHRKEICVPLENNGFVALAAAGEFGRRQGYACNAAGDPVAPVPNGSIVPTASNNFRTFVGYTDIGPDMQLVDNPAEAFPALMLGSPFGVEETSCDRPNPAVPTWHAQAAYRFQVGLADDLIGYLIPAWGFASGTPGLFNNDACSNDAHGRHHKLESESVGPSGGNRVADKTAEMLAAEPDPIAQVVDGGRFVLPDGSYSRWPTGAAGALVSGGSLIGAPETAGFGGRAVDRSGVFMDYDGQPQPRPDVTTRGMMVLDSHGCPVARYYLNVFPAASPPSLGQARTGPAVRPPAACSAPGAGGVQPAAARQALGGCNDRLAPRSVIRGRPRLRRGRLVLHGVARDRGCRNRVARVTVTVGRRVARGRCRFIDARGHLGRPRHCLRGAPQLLARGRAHWTLRVRARLPRGRYVLLVRAVDTAGNTERARRRGANVARLRRR
jgi:hypothetical protein